MTERGFTGVARPGRVGLLAVLLALAGLPLVGSVGVVSAAPGSFVDDTVADFGAGSVGAGTYLAETGDGEVILAPTVGAEFSGSALPADWESSLWTPPNGSATVAGGVLTLDGALARTTSTQPADSSLEFVATFGSAPFQHVGLGSTNMTFNEEPWAIFSTGVAGTELQARTFVGGVFTDTSISADPLGEPHRYRIDWEASSVDFYVDGAPVATHAVTIAGPMRTAASDFTSGDTTLAVDWARVSPYASTGTFDSRVFDAGTAVSWDTLSWTSQAPAGTSMTMSVRTGDTPTPDPSWTSFTTIPSSGGSIGAVSRFSQYRAELSTSDAEQTPVLEDVTIAFSDAPVNQPTISGFTPDRGRVGKRVTVTGTNFLEPLSVSFDGTAATNVTVVSGTQIIARVPDGAGTGPISVTTTNGTATSATDFIVVPRITGFTPTSGPVGTPVTITGTSFTDVDAVRFNRTAATFVVIDDHTIAATVPAGATTGKIRVATPFARTASRTNFVVT
jgi:IPT/TIG domain/Glycosyl hydrolases family 16